MLIRLFLFTLATLILNTESIGDFSEDEGKVRVVIIDSGLDLNDPRFDGVLCKKGHKDLTGRGLNDVNGHGTHIAGLIQQYAGSRGYCLIIVKSYHESDLAYVDAYKYAFSLKPDVINVSLNGDGYYKIEEKLLRKNPNVKLVAAAGNEGLNLDEVKRYPGGLKLPNVYTVGNMLNDDERNPSSNYGSNVRFWEIGTNVYSDAIGNGLAVKTGSSMSTAIKTGKMTKELVNAKIIVRN